MSNTPQPTADGRRLAGAARQDPRQRTTAETMAGDPAVWRSTVERPILPREATAPCLQPVPEAAAPQQADKIPEPLAEHMGAYLVHLGALASALRQREAALEEQLAQVRAERERLDRKREAFKQAADLDWQEVPAL